MPRTPEEIYAEIAAWPLAERLRLAARIVAEAAQLAQAAREKAPAVGQRLTAAPETPTSQESGGEIAGVRARPAAGSPSPTRAVPALRQSPPTQAQVPAPTAEARRLVVVDGSNFLGTVSGFDLASDGSREVLITRLQDFAHDHPAFRVVSFFDGQKATVRRAGGVEIRFTGGPKPADFFILEALRALPDAERARALLVTADRALGDSARRLNVKVEAPASFHARLPAARRTDVGQRGLSPAEVAAWESYFQRPPDPPGKKKK